MKKSNIKKIILSLTLSFVMLFSTLPTNLNKLFANADTFKDVYKTPSTVDVSGTFDPKENSTQPNNWTVSSEYSNTDDIDSTSYNGVLSSNLTDWKNTNTNWLNNWLDSWSTNHELIYTESTDKDNIINAIKNSYSASYILGNSPLVPNYELGSTTDFNILALMSGYTYTKYLNADESVGLETADRTGYVKYTSNSFKLDQYSYYKITVWVKTVGTGSFASIAINGDINENVFNRISSPTATPTTYYLYTFTNASDSSSVNFWSTSDTSVSTLTYDGVEYTLDTTIPDQPKYTHPTDENKTIVFAERTEVATHEDWVQKTIYISTTTESSISLELALGNSTEKSTGSAFFDNVKVEKIQLLDFYQNAATAVESNPTDNAIIDLREISKSNQNNTDSRNYTVIDSFNTVSDWTPINADLNKDVVFEIKEESPTTLNKETFPKDSGDAYNKMLSIKNTSTKEIAVKSTEVTLEKGRYYRISLWAYSAQSDATIKVNMVSNKANETTETTALISTKPYLSDRVKDNVSNINNFWVNYVFYVQASADKSSTGYIKLTIPTGITINVDNFVMEYVSKDEYTNTSQTKLDLLSKTTDEVITNGKFNSYTSVDVDKYSSLLPPSGWTSTKKVTVYEYYNNSTSDKYTTAHFEEDLTINTETNTITYDGKDFVKANNSNTYNYYDGNIIKERIVKVENVTYTYNSTESCYENTNYADLDIESNVSAGIKLDSNDCNTLNFIATTNEEFTYKSSVIKLSSTGSVYIISTNIYTDSSSALTLKLVDKDGNVYGTLADVSSEDEWRIVSFYVSTGLETIELYLEITHQSAGTTKVKNIKALKTTTTTIIDKYLSKSTSELDAEGIAIINLAKETFVEHSTSINTETNLYDTDLYNLVEHSGKTSGIYGVLDTSTASSTYPDITSNDADVSPYVLIIKNNAGEYTEIEALKKFTVEKSKYMLITITARVEGLTNGKSATINFKSLNKTFEVTSDEFVEYKLYVDNYSSTSASTIKYAFALLNSAGTLIVDSVKAESLTSISSAQSEYPNGDTATVKFVTTSEALKDQAKDEKNKADADALEIENEDNTLEIFLAIFSSLLLVAAIIFAIVFVRVKKLNLHRKKSQKNKVSETDNGEKGFV